jgi:hypothetical protein
MAKSKDTGDVYYPPKDAENGTAFFGAINEANRRERTITMVFRDVAIPVKRDSTIRDVEAAFLDKKLVNVEQDVQRATAEVKIRQPLLDVLTGAALDQAVKGGLPDVIQWSREYIRAVELAPGVDFKAGEVLAKLLKSGYKATEATPEHTQNAETYGRNVVGAMMMSLALGDHPPHAHHFTRQADAYQQKRQAMAIKPQQPTAP